LTSKPYGVFGLVSVLEGVLVLGFVAGLLGEVSVPQPMVVVTIAATRTRNAINLFTVNPSFPEVAETMIPGHTVAWVIPLPQPSSEPDVRRNLTKF